MTKEAGVGNHKAYPITPNDAQDNTPLQARKHYVGVDAISWYINKESSWFTKRMVSGTLEVKIANGQEKYQAALGTFSLRGGAKFAPIFNRPVLPDRNYRGGSITFTAHLTAVKKDTVVAGLLKNAANASLGIVAGMVDTAAISGPTQLLAAASGELVGGVRSILGGSAEGREPLFADNGLEITVQASDITGPATFLLLHRGSDLDESNLEVRSNGESLQPFYNGEVLEDGAWLLLRIRRTDEYSSIRSWFPDTRSLRSRIDDLANDVADGILDKSEALAQLLPSDRGNTTIYDEYLRLRAVIRNDGVLTEREAASYVGQLRSRLVLAKKAIENNESSVLAETMNSVAEAIVTGQPVPSLVNTAFEEESEEILVARNPSLNASTNIEAIADLSGPNLFKSLKYIPNTFDLSIS